MNRIRTTIPRPIIETPNLTLPIGSPVHFDGKLVGTVIVSKPDGNLEVSIKDKEFLLMMDNDARRTSKTTCSVVYEGKVNYPVED
jgi:hypothetical protein